MNPYAYFEWHKVQYVSAYLSGAEDELRRVKDSALALPHAISVLSLLSGVDSIVFLEKKELTTADEMISTATYLGIDKETSNQIIVELAFTLRRRRILGQLICSPDCGLLASWNSSLKHDCAMLYLYVTDKSNPFVNLVGNAARFFCRGHIHVVY